ncbi:MAG: hypothetical protein KKE44_10775 [Proteobacteria bacterium]|nr:hypothetical protein [Pseudomonadota bacterium]MBU1583206.1 hypothetical protein [Pseudomonadota bacterium]MBU2455051.1 hypothetical protein [Pseudomonadota bacterium]MBU2627655.1 hypothetical protein [Pseudomonadota bacterium]
MKIVYINKKNQCRMVTFDEAENRFWVEPYLRERLIEKRMVGFDLDQLESIKEMPTIAEKISPALPLVYLLMIFKDKRQVAVGVDKNGLYAITAALKIAEQRNDDVSNSLVYKSL